MLSQLLISMTVCLMVWVYLRWVRVRSYWAMRGVPHLPPHPVYGSLTFLQKMNIGIFMRQIYNRFQSPYVGIWLFWRPALIVNCPKIGSNILVKDSAIFRDRFVSGAPNDPTGYFNIFTAKDPLWSNVRRRLTPAFTSSKLKGIQLLLNIKGKELVARIAQESKKDKFNYRSVFNDYTTDVIGMASFGVKSDATLTGTSPIREVTKDFERFNWLRGISWSCIFFLPELVGPLRFTFFPKSTTEYFRKVYKAVVELREAENNENVEPRDLLDILLKMKKEMVLNNEEITDEVIISQAAIFTQAGFNTSGTLLTFSTYELAHHPEIQEKLYKELKEAKDSIEDADFDKGMLGGLTYLNCVIKANIRPPTAIFFSKVTSSPLVVLYSAADVLPELSLPTLCTHGMRKYQTLGWLDRISSENYKIDDKLTIPAGTPVYINTTGIFYDPDYFPDPTRFDPDRFLPENKINIKKYTFMPFGDGPRKCIGQRFGFATVRTALAAIVLNYELRPVPNSPKPSEIPIEKYGLLLAPGEVLYVEFVPRK